MRGLIRTIALAGALVAIGAPSAAIAASPDGPKLVQIILGKYLTTGRIDACAYTVEELQAAADNVGSDIRQYASDFPAALRDALNARARGACEEATPAPTAAATAAPTVATGGGGAAPPPTSSATAAPTAPPTRRVVPEPPAPAAIAVTPQATAADPSLERAASSTPQNDTPVPLIGLGVLSSLSLLTVLLLGALKRLGSAEGRLAPAYHSWREAQWRAGGVWEDFRDWLRFGR